jgi:hypothetical protein
MELDIYMVTLWLQILVELWTIIYQLVPPCDRFDKLNTVDMDSFRIMKSYYGCLETRRQKWFYTKCTRTFRISIDCHKNRTISVHPRSAEMEDQHLRQT